MLLVRGRYAAFAAHERSSARGDLNGDGDLRDRVLFVRDAANQQLVNTGQAVRRMAMSESRVVFTTREADQRVDLNGDGDRRDEVVQIWDLAAGVATSSRLDARAFAFAGDHVLVAVREKAQGRVDLNGDGDTGDVVAIVYDIPTAATLNLGYAMYQPELAARISDTACVFLVSEGRDGKGDVNGNGAVNNNVAKTYVFATDTMIHVDLAASVETAVGDQLAAFTVSERFNGMTDLNGDGDHTVDYVVHVVDLGTGEVRNTGSQGRLPLANGDTVLFASGEGRQGGADLNGDFDAEDVVARAYTFPTATLVGLGAVRPDRGWIREFSGARYQRAFRAAGSRVVFLGRERRNSQDGNADLDVRDQIAFVFDTATHTLTNTGLDVVGYDIAVDLLAVATRERAQGRVDDNLDADKRDQNLFVYDLANSQAHHVRVAVAKKKLAVGDDFVAFGAKERMHFQSSYNEDPDTRDAVIGWTGLPPYP